MNQKKTIVTFPRMGIYTEAIEHFLTELKIDYIVPPPITKKTIEIGTQELDELFCYPAKTTLGNYVEAIEKGANTLVMFTSEGSCRFKNYYKMHELVLKKMGYNVRMCAIRTSSFLGDIKKIDKNIKLFSIIRAIKSTWKKILEIEKRDSEKNPKNPDLKILVCGEIYCVNEDKVNMDLVKKLRDMNVHVECIPTLSHFIKESLHLCPLEKLKEKKEAKEFLPHKKFGGHAFQTLYEIIHYIKKGYDGVFHAYPFPCMPQSSITVYLDIISEKYDHFPIQNLQCDEFSGEAGFDTRVEAFVDGLNFRKYGINLKITEKKGYWLGIDIGSVSSKATIINEKNDIVASSYILISGNPIEGVKECLKKLPSNYKISGVGITGSARYLISKVVGGDVIRNEITAQILGALSVNKNIKSIIEIGGLDSKCIILREGIPIWHNLNSKCSAGTGSFLMREAERVKIPIEKFGDYALKSKMNLNIAGKCTVFAGQDCIHKAQSGFKNEDIIKGLHMSLVRNFINNAARNKKLETPIMFSGGVAANKGVVESFKKCLGSDLIVPKHHKVLGAKGMAILSKNTVRTNFKGFKVKNMKFKNKNFECDLCPSHCEIIRLYHKKKLVFRSSGICKRYEGET